VRRFKMNHTDEFNRIMAANKPTKKVKKQIAIIKQIKPKENMTPLQESISKCTINGNIVILPIQKIDNYPQLRKALMDAGATYNKNTFIFPNDAEQYINRLMGGKSINIKKEFQFFGTPDKLANQIIKDAEIELYHSVNEPSAGQGALVKAFHRLYPNKKIECFELMDINRNILEKMPNVILTEWDFLKIGTEYNNKFDRIIANPPFNKNQDIDHILKMWDCLTNNGRIVTIASKHWQHSKNKKETKFREWLNEINATITDIPAGEFSESGTKIATCKIIINK